jgi:hypothetical protein
MLSWLVMKAVLGMKAVILAGTSLLTSVDWSPRSSNEVQAFLAGEATPSITVEVTVSDDRVELRKAYRRVARLEDVSQVLDVSTIVEACRAAEQSTAGACDAAGHAASASCAMEALPHLTRLADDLAHGAHGVL